MRESKEKACHGGDAVKIPHSSRNLDVLEEKVLGLPGRKGM